MYFNLFWVGGGGGMVILEDERLISKLSLGINPLFSILHSSFPILKLERTT